MTHRLRHFDWAPLDGSVNNLKNLIDAYEHDMILTRGEFNILAFNILMHDQLQEVRAGNIVGGGLTCCCGNGHTDNDYMECDLSIHPHGYSINKKGSLWQRLKKALFPKTKWMRISGGC